MSLQTQYYLVLDANILIADFWMEGHSFSYLRRHRFLEHRPVIPKVAFLEAKGHLKRRVETLLSNRNPDGTGAHGNTVRLQRLFNRKEATPPRVWDIEALLDRWDELVYGVLDRHGGMILESPDVDLQEITQRSLERRRPFSAGDKGFRDTLIWLGVLELASQDSLVSFVTRNTQDFFAAEDPHPEIVKEAEEKLQNRRKVMFHKSLDDFITRFDSDREASSLALKRALLSNTFSGFDLWEWLETNLPDIYGGGDRLDMVQWAGLPISAEAPFLKKVEQLVTLDVARIKHLSDDTYRIYADFSFIGSFEASIGYLDADNVVHPRQQAWKDESDPFWTEVGLRAVGTFLIAVDLDVTRKAVLSYFTTPLEHWTTYGGAIERLEQARNEVSRVGGRPSLEDDQEGANGA